MIAAPQVSASLPLHNGSSMIAKALESVRAQNYPHVEILVVDDGSEDQGTERVREFPEVRLIRQAAGGVASARNIGLKASFCQRHGVDYACAEAWGSKIVHEHVVVRKRIHEANESRHAHDMALERMQMLARLKQFHPERIST